MSSDVLLAHCLTFALCACICALRVCVYSSLTFNAASSALLPRPTDRPTVRHQYHQPSEAAYWHSSVVHCTEQQYYWHSHRFCGCCCCCHRVEWHAVNCLCLLLPQTRQRHVLGRLVLSYPVSTIPRNQRVCGLVE
jgi:hypothetical protein